MMRRRIQGTALGSLLTFAIVFGAVDPAAEAYRAAVEKWRQDRETRLKSDTGWLTVAGLFWLKPGANRFGSAKDNDIVLPSGAPGLAGIFELKGDKVTVKIQSGATVTSAGEAITQMEMKSDSEGEPSILALGDLSMFVIKRGDKYAIRLKDKNSRMRKDFTGLTWFGVDPGYRITAEFTPFEPAKQIPIPNILGQTENLPSPGYVTFRLHGKNVRLEPVLESPDAKELFFIFRDKTSGKTTYPSGRFLYAEMAQEGKVVLDFNKAYNPPCAFTPYATCPLPPPQNRLEVPIEAGERNYGHH